MKKAIAVCLALVVVLASVSTVYAAQPETILPNYENASAASVTLTINEHGTASVQLYLQGSESLKQAEITLYLEKKVGSTWTRVDISAVNDEWTLTTTNKNLNKLYSTPLSTSGEYRAVAEFKLTGTTVEYITRTSTATYTSE